MYPGYLDYAQAELRWDIQDRSACRIWPSHLARMTLWGLHSGHYAEGGWPGLGTTDRTQGNRDARTRIAGPGSAGLLGAGSRPRCPLLGVISW